MWPRRDSALISLYVRPITTRSTQPWCASRLSRQKVCPFASKFYVWIWIAHEHINHGEPDVLNDLSHFVDPKEVEGNLVYFPVKEAADLAHWFFVEQMKGKEEQPAGFEHTIDLT